MREPIGCTDDERVEGVATVEAGSAGNGWIDGVGTFSEVVGPTLLGGDGLTIFVPLVGVTRRFEISFVSAGVGLWEGGVVGVLGGRGTATVRVRAWVWSLPNRWVRQSNAIGSRAGSGMSPALCWRT